MGMVLNRMSEQTLVISTSIDGESFQPVVALTCAAEEFQMRLTPEQAQRMAYQMAEAAEASLHESFLLLYLQHQLGLEPKSAYEALDNFRQWRTQTIGPRFQ